MHVRRPAATRFEPARNAGARRPPRPPCAAPRDGFDGGGDVDVGLLWQRAGGGEVTVPGFAPAEEVLKAEPALPPPPVEPPPAPPAHSAIKDRAAFDRLHAASTSQPAAFWTNLAGGLAWRNAPASGAGAARVTPAGFAPPFFAGGRLSLTTNALTRHVDAGQGAARALAFAGGGLCFADADAVAWRLAGWLRGAGVQRGDVVAVCLASGPDLGLAVLAAAGAGAAVLCLDPGSSPADLAASIMSSGARVAITSSDVKAAKLHEALALAADDAMTPHSLDTVLVHEVPSCPVADTPWTCARDVWAGAALAAASSLPPNARPAVEPGAPLLLLPAPGAPGALIMHPVAAAVGGASTARLALDAGSDAVVAWAGASPTHPAALITCLLGSLVNGGSCALLPAGPADAWWAAARATGVTHAVADAAAAAALAAAAPAPLRGALVVDAGPAAAAAAALATALGPAVPLVTAWQPAGAGTPVLAGAPHAACPAPGGMLPWLGCAKPDSPASPAWGGAWPALAGGVAGGPRAEAWWADACASAGAGSFAPKGAALTVDGDGVFWWA
jgi:hypothetical protein